MQVKFNVTGRARKSLAAAISEILDQPINYKGAPTFSYSVGDYTLEKDGTLLFDGEMDSILDELKDRGYTLENPEILSIGYPADGFSEEALANLRRMIAAKALLIQKALDMTALPIEVTDTEIRFPWFWAGITSEKANAYAQFIAALCKTAREKKHVTAKAPEHFENERFTMRVWLIGLGLVGDEYKLIRKLMCQPLSGNAAWRYGAPKKKAAPAAEGEGTANG
jgi:hypothetical protein